MKATDAYKKVTRFFFLEEIMKYTTLGSLDQSPILIYNGTNCGNWKMQDQLVLENWKVETKTEAKLIDMCQLLSF